MTQPAIIGRFAPTPSGPLHFGSLVSALASYCQSRSQQGDWLLRIEDVDTPRVVKDSDSQILTALEAYGFEWDGPVMYQSDRFENYRETLASLTDVRMAYACDCSRRSLREIGTSSGPMGAIYPGICSKRDLPLLGHSIRVDTSTAGNIGFEDSIYGRTELDINKQVGDFVLRRVDGIYAYHLAVVLDDAEQGITHIMRGADLLYSSCLHIFLQRILKLPATQYLHIPLVKNDRGEKLSKQGGASAIQLSSASQTLVTALKFLAQTIEPGLEQEEPKIILQQAVKAWDNERLIEVR